MEFNEKLLMLRKAKGLTQESLAEALFVSRTAVSKWESGRGYPNIESLKAISRLFGVTIDELLSGDELLSVAEADHQEKVRRHRDVVFVVLDCCVSVLFFLPFFRQQMHGTLQAVGLLSLTEIAAYLKIAYFAAVSGVVLSGILSFLLHNRQNTFWNRNQYGISLGFHAAAIVLFMISPQPYAASLLFAFLSIKAWLLMKLH